MKHKKDKHFVSKAWASNLSAGLFGLSFGLQFLFNWHIVFAQGITAFGEFLSYYSILVFLTSFIKPQFQGVARQSKALEIQNYTSILCLLILGLVVAYSIIIVLLFPIDTVIYLIVILCFLAFRDVLSYVVIDAGRPIVGSFLIVSASLSANILLFFFPHLKALHIFSISGGIAITALLITILIVKGKSRSPVINILSIREVLLVVKTASLIGWTSLMNSSRRLLDIFLLSRFGFEDEAAIIMLCKQIVDLPNVVSSLKVPASFSLIKNVQSFEQTFHQSIKLNRLPIALSVFLSIIASMFLFFGFEHDGLIIPQFSTPLAVLFFTLFCLSKLLGPITATATLLGLEKQVAGVQTVISLAFFLVLAILYFYNILTPLHVILVYLIAHFWMALIAFIIIRHRY